MTRIRHNVANGLYSLATRIDRPVFEHFGDERIGDDRQWASDTPGSTPGQFQIHMRNDSPVGADFKPGSFTYAALNLGGGATVTVFLTRAVARRMLGVIKEVDARYSKYGEHGR